MSQVLPAAAQSLRSLYRLGSDRLWFGLAVLTGLILAGEIVSLLAYQTVPAPELLSY